MKFSPKVSRSFFIPAKPRGHQGQPVPVNSSTTTPLFTCLPTVVSLQVTVFVACFVGLAVYLGNGDGFSSCTCIGIGCERQVDSELTAICLDGGLMSRCCSAPTAPFGSNSIIDATDTSTTTIGYNELALACGVLQYDKVLQ